MYNSENQTQQDELTWRNQPKPNQARDQIQA